MKKLYFLFTLAFLSTSFLAQDDCYEQYRKVFENRGADDVGDGIHDNVILSVREEGVATDCFVCTVIIKNNEIVEIAIYFEDDTKEVLEYEFKEDIDWNIFNGISRTRVTEKDQKINLMFTDKIKPKKKKYKKAPLPKFELN